MPLHREREREKFIAKLGTATDKSVPEYKSSLVLGSGLNTYRSTLYLMISTDIAYLCLSLVDSTCTTTNEGRA